MRPPRGESPPRSPDCAIVYGLTTFSLTSGLAYRSVRVTVVGHTFEDYNPGDAFFVRWSNGTPDFAGSLPEYLQLPRSVGANPTTNVSSDRKVRFGVYCTEDLGDAFDLHYVRFTYQYAVWK